MSYNSQLLIKFSYNMLDPAHSWYSFFTCGPYVLSLNSLGSPNQLYKAYWAKKKYAEEENKKMNVLLVSESHICCAQITSFN